MTEQKPKALPRIGSMLLDHIAMGFVAMGPFAAFIFTRVRSFSDVTHAQSGGPEQMWLGGTAFIFIIGSAVYLCKDSIQGRSVAKRATKLQVVENASGKVASPLRCFVRNLTFFLFPLEVIVALVNPSRRIGDFIAGTRVVVFDPQLEQPKFDIPKTAVALAISYTIFFVFAWPINKAMNRYAFTPVQYAESSINPAAAEELRQLYIDNLGAEVDPDVVVYDRVEDDSTQTFVSVILQMKGSFDYSDNFKITSEAAPLLHSLYPAGTVVGQIKLVTRSMGQNAVTTIPIRDYRKQFEQPPF